MSSLTVVLRCRIGMISRSSLPSYVGGATRIASGSMLMAPRQGFARVFPHKIGAVCQFSTSCLRYANAKGATIPDQPTTPEESISQKSRDSSSNSSSPEFTKSEKARQAAKVNLSARLSKRDAPNKGGMSEITRLFSLSSREIKPMLFAVGLLVISSAVSLTLPMSIGKIMDAANSTEVHKTVFGLELPYFYGGIATLFVIGACANFGRVVSLRIIGERLVARLRVLLFKQTIQQDSEFFDANRVGDLISRLSSDANIVAKSLTQNVSDGLRSGLSCVFGLAMMAYVSLKLTSMIVLIVPPIFLGSWFYGKKVRQLSRDLQKAVGSLTKVSEERLSNVKTAQAFVGEVQEIHRYSDKIRDVFNIGKREAIAAGAFFGSTGLAGNLTVLSLLALGSQMVSSGQMTIGELTSFTMYTGYCGSSAFGLSSFYSELMKGAGAASRLFELMDRKPVINPTKGLKLKSARDTITFENVAFAYPTRPAVQIFDKISFSIPAGSNVCIVGPSGGGKSTITSLLLRFYDPTAGKILIGPHDIRSVSLKSLRRQIGVVAQEPVLFSGTIADNIAYGLPAASRFQIAQAARKANCDFISDFPDGLDTFVGARGTQLSGGQKQRIAIARALIKNPAILILDEATSALDAESEAAVNEALSKLMLENSTTISIAHRLSTIRRSDHVIVLSADGKVAEQGRFNELFARADSALSYLLRARDEDTDGAFTSPELTADDAESEELLEEEVMEELEQQEEEQEKIDTKTRLGL